jgi:SAM-dependent methyltransferase
MDRLQLSCDRQLFEFTLTAPRRRISAGIDEGLHVQYGCGICAPAEWLNFDASPRLRLERIPGVRGILSWTIGLLFPPNVRFGDIVPGLPIPDKSANGVYCSHVLEHLARNDLAPALRNTLRILRPGGIFRLVVPDLHWRALRYVAAAASGKHSAAEQFMSATGLGRGGRPKDLATLARNYFGHSAHLWMYDFASLRSQLEDAGFVAIRRCELGDAKDRMFDLVEDRGRFFHEGERELAIEAAAPLD